MIKKTFKEMIVLGEFMNVSISGADDKQSITKSNEQ